MKIGIEDIKKIVEDANRMKHDVKVGDIAYLILSRTITDRNVVYATIFGKGFGDDIPLMYEKSSKIRYLKKYLNANYPDTSEKKHKKKVQDISFEDNKMALIAKLEELQHAVDNGDIAYKDSLRAEIDIRTKLNDKFSVNEGSEQQMIVVQPKFNHICDYTHKECWLQTKEYAMQHWDLVERENFENQTEEEDE